jgi:choline dehydrogenase-like flavoprotein
MPMAEADNRVQEVVRGEGLGGTSRLNGMLYTRGPPGDYNGWKAMGHPDWGYDELLPYFVKSETTLSQPPSSYRGRTGE